MSSLGRKLPGVTMRWLLEKLLATGWQSLSQMNHIMTGNYRKQLVSAVKSLPLTKDEQPDRILAFLKWAYLE